MADARNSFGPDLWAALAAILIVAWPVSAALLARVSAAVRLIVAAVWTFLIGVDAWVLAFERDTPLLRSVAAVSIGISAFAMSAAVLDRASRTARRTRSQKKFHLA